jgi:hypothetical protein
MQAASGRTLGGVLLIGVLFLMQASFAAMWLSPAERAHKAEFFAAWEQRYGPIPANNPPVAMLKTWYRQWKQTKLEPGPWLDANVGQGPPGGHAGGAGAGPAGGVPGGTNL